MSHSAPSSLFALAVLSVVLAVGVNGQTPTGTYPAVPLASKHFNYPDGVPYKADTDQGLIRGTQLGYNMCNSTTEGPTSLCQTSFVNSISDFCLWAPSKPDSVVADTEGEMVAWCTKPGRGTRTIPQGALTGVQFIQTPNYIQLVGFINQPLINLKSDDWGGEMDPHGADLRGNPMGGLMYSQAFGGNGNWNQVIEWTNFMGGNAFCLKACDPNKPDDDKYCEHRFDRIGCAYNVPNNAQNGTFESCQGDNGDFTGIYTENGEVKTYTQPAESLGPITTMPYTARIPASSSCTTYTSASLYTDLPAPSILPAGSSAASGSSSPTGTGASARPTGAASGTRSGSAATAQQTGNSASTLTSSGLSLLGIAFSIFFFA